MSSSSRELEQNQLHDFENPGYWKQLVSKKKFPFFRKLNEGGIVYSGVALLSGIRFYECHIPNVAIEPGDKVQWRNDATKTSILEIVTREGEVKGEATKYNLTKDQFYKSVKLFNNAKIPHSPPPGK